MKISIQAAAAAITLFASQAAHAQGAVQWRVEDGGNGHWYQFVPNTTGTWDEGRLAAQSAGGHLATLTAAAENEFANGIVSASDIGWIDGLYGPFIGGSRHGQPSWTWLTTETFAFQPWGPGEPNNDSGGCAQEEYLTMLNHPSAPATWNDVTNGARAGSQCLVRTSSGFMVEWSADCNSDGIVDYGQILQGQLADTNADGVPDICQGPTCADADIYRDFNVNGADLGILLSQWGPNTPLTESDLNDDGVVNGADLGLLLSFWGACP